MTLYNDNLKNYYDVNFALIHHHKYSLSEIENMLPWEREVYLTLLIQHVEKENEKIKLRNTEMASRQRSRR